MKEEDKGKERSKRSKIRKRKGGGIRKKRKRKRRRYDEKNRKRRGSKTMMRERMKRRNGRNRGRRREREKHKSKGQPHRLHKSKQNLDNHCFSSSSRWFCVLRERITDVLYVAQVFLYVAMEVRCTWTHSGRLWRGNRSNFHREVGLFQVAVLVNRCVCL